APSAAQRMAYTRKKAIYGDEVAKVVASNANKEDNKVNIYHSRDKQKVMYLFKSKSNLQAAPLPNFNFKPSFKAASTVAHPKISAAQPVPKSTNTILPPPS